MASLGLVLLGVALLSAFGAISAFALGKWGGMGDGMSKLGYYATFTSAIALTLATLLMIVAFFTKDFSFLYVVENHSPDTSSLAWLYTLSGLWAGREGSFLFWTWLLSLFAAWVAYRRFSVRDQLSNMGLMVTNIVQMLFSAGMLFSTPNNPFKTAIIGADGSVSRMVNGATQVVGDTSTMGMNPLLQHWAMVIHPPTLFIGYAGLTIPFAFAVAAIIENDGSRAWVDIVDRITVFAWLFLGAGIGLGAVWAYVVLGWGGYWGWDPVENASLLPWLTGVALLHSFTMYRRRDGFKKWSISLAAVSFALVILGTFITRSGIVQSVHAFEADPVSLYLFLAMIIAAFAVAIIGPTLRGATFSGNDEFESLTGREAAYYFNNVIMLVAGLLVAYLTVTSGFKGFLGWLPLAGKSIPPTTYDALARPVGVLYAFIIAVCPILSWRSTDGATFWNRVKWPLVGALAIFALLIVELSQSLLPIYTKMVAMKDTSAAGLKMANAGPAGYYIAIAVLGFFAASLVIAVTVSLFITGAKKRAEAREEGFFTAFWNILTKARSQSGGYLSHIGIGIILIGLVGSAMFVYDNTFTIENKTGSTLQVDQYTFTLTGGDSQTLPNNRQVDTVNLDVTRGGKTIGTISPGQTTFTNTQQTRTDAKVLSEPLRDIFVTMQGADQNGVTINVKINPLIWFSWIGFLVLMLGTALASWPKGEPQPVPASRKGSRKAAKR